MTQSATSFVDNTIAQDVFSPIIWSKAVITSLEAKLAFAKCVNRQFEANASVGYRVNVASIGDFTATAKSENGAISYETIAEAVKYVTMNQWYYAAFAIEDLVKLQSNIELRSKYQEKCGYALAKQVDDILADRVADFAQYGGTLGVCFTDDLIRAGVQALDDANVPESDRFMIISPAEYNNMLSQDKFTNSLYKGGARAVDTGSIGNVYGLEVFKTTNINKSASTYADNVIMHKEALALVLQQAPRVGTFYDLDYLCWKVAVDEIYGSAEMKDTSGYWLKGKS